MMKDDNKDYEEIKKLFIELKNKHPWWARKVLKDAAEFLAGRPNDTFGNPDDEKR
jgi:hypothetical protein